GLDAVVPDFKVINEYNDQRFNKLRLSKEQEILGTGVIEPAAAQQAAARWASEQMDGYIPEKFGDLIKYSPDERHAAAVNQSLNIANLQITGAMRVIEAGGVNTTVQPGLFRDIMQSVPNLKPEERDRALVDIAQLTASRLAPKLEAGGVPGPLAQARAMMIAGQLTGGTIPPQWQQLIAGNPQAFGLTPQVAELYLTGKYNIFQKGGMEAMLNAAGEKALSDDLTKRAIGTITQPDVAAGVMEKTRAQQQPLTTALKEAGPQQRTIETQQKSADTAATTNARVETEREQVVKSVATPLSELAKSLRNYMETPLTDPTKLYSKGTLYKDRLKAFRSIIAKGVLLQTGALNEQEQVAAMESLSGLIEAKLRPDSTNEKIQTLNLILGKALGKPVDLLADDPLKPTGKQALRFNSAGELLNPSAAPAPTAKAKPTEGPVLRFDKNGNLLK
ncbi:MAG: hypothetical protein KGI70_03455, partial [Patescibacteria group bacterium]|nr:hypothetical protein [Patescibacteria group bacterium]